MFLYDSKIFKYYIIRLSKNENSLNLSKRCFDSCKKLSIPVEYWEGIDGQDERNIIVPSHLKDNDFLKIIKYNYDDLLSISAISCFLSHFLLWYHCIEINQPIVILEEDVIVVKKLENHLYNKTIVYLGNKEQKEKSINEPLVYFGLPPKRKLFMRRAHAYSVDPIICRQLISDVINYGIDRPVDLFLEYEKYSIIQDDLYAYDDRPEKYNTMISYDKIDYSSKGIMVAKYG